jgi:catechol 2,3-dioxygenase-like lactoylglutathione lyase family enzyme
MGHAPVANDNDDPGELTLPSQIHHVGLTVAHLERSVAFYTRYFGLREVGRNELRGRMISAQTDLEGVVIDVALLAGANALLELLCYRSPEGRPAAPRACDPGAVHVCLVVQDLDATYAAMRGDGVAVHARPAALGAGTKMVYVRDPDGIFVEVIQPADDLALPALLASAEGGDGSLDFGRS